jgi:hypothetical protein
MKMPNDLRVIIIPVCKKGTGCATSVSPLASTSDQPSLWGVMWEPTTTLANQCRPHQRQHPLGWALLVTADKDVDFRHASQSQLLLPGDSSSAAHTATASLLAATPSADSKSGRLEPLGSPPPALTALQPGCSHPAYDTRTLLLAQTSLLRSELRRHSSGTPCL